MKKKIFGIMTLVFAAALAASAQSVQNENAGRLNLLSSGENAIDRKDPRSARVLGMLVSDDKQAGDAVSAPASVKAGEEFQVRITTGGNGCVSEGETQLVYSAEKAADLFVYDLTTATGPDVACTMIYKQFTHTATLKFTAPGTAVIRVWARKQSGAPFGEPVVIEKCITVK